MRVELSEEARAQVEVIDEWWRRNRRSSPTLFQDELEGTLVRLGQAPGLGTVFTSGKRVTRRILLPRTLYHLYFVEHDDCLFVVAVWGAVRGKGPDL